MSTLPALSHFRLGGFVIQATGEESVVDEGATLSKEASSGRGAIFEIKFNDSVLVQAAHFHWNNGEEDVRTVWVVEGAQALNRLEGGLRLGIKRVSDSMPAAERAQETHHLRTGQDCLRSDLRWLELRQARINRQQPNKWSNLYRATLDDLREGAGFDIMEPLERAGGLAVDTKEMLLHAADRTRFALCAIYHVNSSWFPLVAYTVTRIAPLMNNYCCEQN